MDGIKSFLNDVRFRLGCLLPDQMPHRQEDRFLVQKGYDFTSINVGRRFGEPNQDQGPGLLLVKEEGLPI